MMLLSSVYKMFTYHDLYGLMQKRLNAMEFCLFDIKSSIYNLTLNVWEPN